MIRVVPWPFGNKRTVKDVTIKTICERAFRWQKLTKTRFLDLEKDMTIPVTKFSIVVFDFFNQRDPSTIILI